MIFAEFITIIKTPLTVMEIVMMIPYTDMKKSRTSIFWPHASNSYKKYLYSSTLSSVFPTPLPSVDMLNKFQNFLLLLSGKEM